jgi:hypothetical protein
MSQPYVPPRWDADFDELEAAADQLETIKLTVEQFDRAVPIAKKGDLGKLIAFCTSEQLLPADLAAHAILARHSAILELSASGMTDVEFNVAYPEWITGPLESQFVATREPDDEGNRAAELDPDQHLLFVTLG